MCLAGLVRAYLAIPKHKEALCAAREAMKAMPQSAKALTLVGDVYAHHPDGREKVVPHKKTTLAVRYNRSACSLLFSLGVIGTVSILRIVIHCRREDFMNQH